MSGIEKFDKTFKEQVVLRINSRDTTISKISDELGIHYSTVRDCVKSYKQMDMMPSLEAVI